uniref:Origin recognition complex subunit 5 n=1 Tax=Anthurium amnicola TaxID=1678845 RepID=A0A1D1YDL1_9ARAE
MAKEGSISELTKRVTRSDSLKACPRIQLDGQGTVESFLPSISSSLFVRDDPISLDDLLSRFPGRRTQVLEILNLIGPLNSAMIPLFLYGGVSTGKTSVILQIFRHLYRPFVYVSCRSCYSPRILFESVLNHLFFHRKHSGNGFSSATRCERASDFIHLLKDALTQVVTGVKEYSNKSSLKQSPDRGTGKVIYLLFDSVELIRFWDQSSSLISLLFKLHDLLKMPEVGLIYISSTSPESYYLNTGSMEPVPVFFPDYTEDDLYQIFMRGQVNPRLYSSFLRVVLKPFFRVTRRICELSVAFRPLYEKYCEQLSDTRLVPDETMNRRLFDNIQMHIVPSLDETIRVSSCSLLEPNTGKISSGKRNTRKLSLCENYDELDFNMSISMKYLLLSAFLASRNPPTLDSAMFDSCGGSSNQKRKRKSSEASIQVKDKKLEEMLIKGPGSFSLERLLAIFQCITCVLPEEQQLEDHQVYQDEGGSVTSDVLLQLSSLCKASFISKGGSCPLEGLTRYRCTVDEKTALKVARSISFPLSKYLCRG